MSATKKIKFYQSENDGISISITAHLDDGRLSLQGFDHGIAVDDIRGAGEDYEYTLSLDQENSRKLFELLKVSDKTDMEKLEGVKARFGESGGVSELRSYCEENNIETAFSCWP